MSTQAAFGLILVTDELLASSAGRRFIRRQARLSLEDLGPVVTTIRYRIDPRERHLDWAAPARRRGQHVVAFRARIGVS